MLFHNRTPQDVITSLKRCHFDAERGRVFLALERAADLASDFPQDARPISAEAYIRSHEIGQGVRAHARMEQAFNLAKDQGDHATFSVEAYNLAHLAPTEDVFRCWAEVALRELPPGDQDRDGLSRRLQSLNQGTPYDQILLADSAGCEKIGHPGLAAALLEAALAAGSLDIDVETAVRKHRARLLREQDRLQATHWNPTITGERFPASERLALQEALSELERTLLLDEYDPELWNLRSAWCNILGRNDEALTYAEHAIMLRPHGYPKPHINRATALWWVGRELEALEALREAERQAQEIQSHADLQQIRQMREDYSSPRQTPRLDDLLPEMDQALRAARVTCDLELGQQQPTTGNLGTLSAGVQRRVARVAAGGPMACVPLMAELLSDFTPETVACALAQIGEEDRRLRGRCQAAISYIACNGHGLQCRDAARALVLGLFSAGESIRKAYQDAILQPAHLPGSELAGLDVVIRQDLSRFHTTLPELVAAIPPEEGRPGYASAK